MIAAIFSLIEEELGGTCLSNFVENVLQLLWPIEKQYQYGDVNFRRILHACHVLGAKVRNKYQLSVVNSQLFCIFAPKIMY